MYLQGFEIKEKIHETQSKTVYRGIRLEDKIPVIIKVPTSEYPPLREISRYQHEYRVLKTLDLEGVIKIHDLVKYKNAYAIIEEDFQGESLKQVITAVSLTIEQFLKIAIDAAHGLANLHQNDIIHKDIKPGNLIVNRSSWDVKISDFGLSTLLSRENQEIKNPELLEGTLAYMSPEQTGRMNRAIDYRTDLYSMGITLYEALTGRLPFEAADPLELVHAHLARKPKSPLYYRPEAPEMLSRIILKLMAKNAEDRYNGAYGLEQDLIKCRDLYRENGDIEIFQLGKNDVSSIFRLSQKLYGRQEEVAILLATFERIHRGTSELMLVNGYSGIGKSVLVMEIHKPIVKQKGYFVSGKFDQFQKGTPYSSLIQAFRQLIQQILTESQDRIADWKDKLLGSLGSNAQVIIELLPALELVIGPQPPVPSLGPSESQNRFDMVFQQFISVFARPEHPLVVFLDDLQWADVATLNLIRVLTTDVTSRHLFLIGAYRDNEVGPSHPLMITVQEIQKAEASVHFIHLEPLKASHLNQLVADSLVRNPEDTLKLSALLDEKTGGNPFFLTQLLRSLYEDNLLDFNLKKGRWEWDLARINQIGISDNVVDLMTAKIQKQPEKSREVLKLAACIGNVFQLHLLATISEQSEEDTHLALWPAIREGLIQTLGDDYRFLHDRIQQASYALIPEEDKKAIHLRIGWLIYEETGVDQIQEHIFEIVNHFNRGRELVTDPDHQKMLGRLNVYAGTRARQSTAYRPAMTYLEHALKDLTGEDWKTDYRMMLDLYTTLAECQALTGNFEESEKTFEIAQAHAQNKLDRVAICATQMPLYQIQGTNLLKGVEVGLRGVKLMGIDLPLDSKILNQLIEQELATLENQLKGVRIADLLNRPEMQDEEGVAFLELMVDFWTAAYLAGQIELTAMVTYKIINYTLENGISKSSCFACMAYATMIGYQGRYAESFAWASLAIEMNRIYLNPRLTGKIHNLYGHIPNPFYAHLKNNIYIYGVSTRASYECGDVVWGVWSLVYTIWTRFMIGHPINEVCDQVNKFKDAALQTRDDNMIQIMGIQQHVLLNLQGLTNGYTSLSTGSFDEVKAIGILEQNGFEVGANWYYTLKCMICFFYGDYETALEMARKSEKTLAANTGFFNITKHYFYYALTLAALYPKAEKEEQQEFLVLLEEHLERFRVWAESAPMNYEHKYLLIRAELARIKGQDLDAMKYYDSSVEKARENEYEHHGALAQELAARFYAHHGRIRVATVYMRGASYGYLKWGAGGKVAHLKIQNPELFIQAHSEEVFTDSLSDSLSTGSTTTTVDREFSSFDLNTVIKVSQAISGQIVLEKLLSSLMSYVLQNAGARRGFMILPKNGNFFIEAEGSVENEEIAVLESVPVRNSNKLCEAIVYYVARTMHSITLDDALKKGDFRDDIYIRSNRTRSLLCMPILNQGKLSGILYLENRLVKSAFTPDRLKVLQIIASQVAISIENALLYQNLEQKVRERTAELEKANEEITTTLNHLKRTQTQLVQSEKMASLGQLVAGIAHEVNTPAGAIFAAINEVDADYVQILEQQIGILTELDAPLWENFLEACRAILQQGGQEVTTKDQRTIARVLQKQLEDMGVDEARAMSKDLALVGFNESTTPILGPLLKTGKAQEIRQAFRQLGMSQIHVRDIKIAIGRIVQLVKALKSYSRLDSSALAETDLREGMDNTLIILHNKLKRAVVIHKEYEEIPLINTHVEQLNQVWTNLIHNSIQAMRGEGDIWLRLKQRENAIIVEIEDNGPGIPADILPHIFDPYFTTKPQGEGTGLGLSICKDIVSRVQGRIEVESSPGSTCFRVSLPLYLEE